MTCHGQYVVNYRTIIKHFHSFNYIFIILLWLFLLHEIMQFKSNFEKNVYTLIIDKKILFTVYCL